MTRRRGQGGQTLIIFALLLAFFFLGMIALVTDAGTLFVAYNRIDSAALLAVQSGASAIDADAFYHGTVRLNAAEAERRCQESLAGSGVSGSCRAQGDRLVVAEVRETARLPIPMPGPAPPVRVQRSAQAAFGGSTAPPGAPP